MVTNQTVPKFINVRQNYLQFILFYGLREFFKSDCKIFREINILVYLRILPHIVIVFLIIINFIIKCNSILVT